MKTPEVYRRTLSSKITKTLKRKLVYIVHGISFFTSQRTQRFITEQSRLILYEALKAIYCDRENNRLNCAGEM